jgi:hypothetical protein
VSDIHHEAERETRFKPCYFLIYDNSTADICNRFIRIMPFNWLVWAINESVYIIEMTTGTICPLGTTAAVLITSDIFSMTSICLNISINSILNLYSEPIKEYYDITDSSVPYKFTILDALNILFRNRIMATFTDLPQTTTMSPLLEKFQTYLPAVYDEMQKRVNSRQF